MGARITRIALFTMGAVLLAAALVSAQQPPMPSPPPVPAQGQKQADPPPDARPIQLPQPATGLVHILYVEPKNPAHRPIYEGLKQRGVLEDLREFLAPLRLTVPLLVRTISCGRPNAFYTSGTQQHPSTVTMCYEFVEFIRRQVPKDSCEFGITQEDAVIGQFVDILLHEVAHALFDIFKIPVFGRDEDAADQLAAFILLQFGPDVARRTINATALFFRELAELYLKAREKRLESLSEAMRSRLDLSEFASEHGLPGQRFHNVLCIAFGFSPELFGNFVQRGLLPKERAARCGLEYRQVAHAFRTLINPHIDLQVLMKTHPGRQWLPASREQCR